MLKSIFDQTLEGKTKALEDMIARFEGWEEQGYQTTTSIKYLYEQLEDLYKLAEDEVTAPTLASWGLVGSAVEGEKKGFVDLAREIFGAREAVVKYAATRDAEIAAFKLDLDWKNMRSDLELTTLDLTTFFGELDSGNADMGAVSLSFDTLTGGVGAFGQALMSNAENELTTYQEKLKHIYDEHRDLYDTIKETEAALKGDTGRGGAKKKTAGKMDPMIVSLMKAFGSDVAQEKDAFFEKFSEQWRNLKDEGDSWAESFSENMHGAMGMASAFSDLVTTTSEAGAKNDREQFEARKKGALADVAISTAVAIMTALSTGNYAGVGIATITGALQAANIQAQKYPAMAEGGIVTRPTTALIGEAGPEAVIPLSGAGSIGNSVTVNVAGSVLSESDLRDIITREMMRHQRVH